jgi:hypothetical protein
MELNDNGPINRVQTMLNNSNIGNVLMMQMSISTAYNQEKATAMQNFIASQNWQNGEEVSALIVCLCANFASMPLDRKPLMIDNMLIAMMSLMKPMTLELHRKVKH